MGSTIKILNEDAIEALRRDHEQLRLEVRAMRTILRAMQTTGAGRRTFGRFTLDAALATTDATKAATLIGQYGRGSRHSAAIIVNNPADATNGDYSYEGASGASGWAFFDPIDLKWWIFDMDCP